MRHASKASRLSHRLVALPILVWLVWTFSYSSHVIPDPLAVEQLIDAPPPVGDILIQPEPQPQPVVPSPNVDPIIALLRSIGNPLPPRHDADQAVRNLQFILDHENLSHYPNIHRHWVLNRLVDANLTARIVDLLQGENYTIIPFHLDVYAKIPLTFSLYDPDALDLVHTEQFVADDGDGWIDSNLQHERSMYLCNVNGARNTMLDIAHSRYNDAEWILPWDGNSYLSPVAMRNVLDTLGQLGKRKSPPSDGSAQHPSSVSDKYVVVPMERVETSNEDLLTLPDEKPLALEEPQIIFHKTALGRFHPFLRYGRLNKVELLQRLRVPGKWDHLKFLPMEFKVMPSLLQPLPDLRQGQVVSNAGWVFRLKAGNDEKIPRDTARRIGLHEIFDRLDQRILTELYKFTDSTLLFYNENALRRDRERYRANDMRMKRTLTELLRLAEQSRLLGPWTVMHKHHRTCGVELDCHRYYSLDPYCWPVEGTFDEHEPFIRKDTPRPYTGLYERDSDGYDRTEVASMLSNVTVLSLAYYITGEEDYGNHAAKAVRAWFLDKETRMFPDLATARVCPGHHNNSISSHAGLMELKDVYHFLDAVRILQSGGFLNAEDRKILARWFRAYRRWAERQVVGKAGYSARDYHGIYYDIQLVAISAFLNEPNRMLWYLDRSVSRLRMQFGEDGHFTQAWTGSQCEHAQMVTIQGWTILARMGATVGRDFWNMYKTVLNGMTRSKLCIAASHNIPFLQQREPCPGNGQQESGDHWVPIWHTTRSKCQELKQSIYMENDWVKLENGTSTDDRDAATHIFRTYDAIAPFWNLGNVNSEEDSTGTVFY